jgi:hypothetical protein
VSPFRRLESECRLIIGVHPGEQSARTPAAGKKMQVKIAGGGEWRRQSESSGHGRKLLSAAAACWRHMHREPERRLPVMVKGKRVKAIDVHLHGLFQDAVNLMGDDAGNVFEPSRVRKINSYRRLSKWMRWQSTWKCSPSMGSGSARTATRRPQSSSCRMTSLHSCARCNRNASLPLRRWRCNPRYGGAATRRRREKAAGRPDRRQRRRRRLF